MPSVTRFNVTPVKATRLHHPESVRFEAHGVPGDRDLFFVDEDGRMIAGSKIGPLVQIEAFRDEPGDTLRMRFPDGVEVAAHVVEGPWTEHVDRHTGRALRLARVDRPGDGSDVRPVTLVSLASVDELRRRGDRPLPLDPGRFRMTIELDGAAPHEEDTWDGRRIRVGEATLLVETPVPRCVVTTQDPATGLRDFPTLSVIKRYRGANDDGDLPFGMYASVVEPGLARVGDPIEVLEVPAI
jgi:uncharacterized protein YcbX